ncbi:hypothetical protein [uncultured Porphyromonas sp.]|nr:hypothetical protein [uncultured Porphyromonas sp.]
MCSIHVVDGYDIAIAFFKLIAFTTIFVEVDFNQSMYNATMRASYL